MAHASFQKPIEDIVECPICMETLKNTRVLPCIHTFCLLCIKKHGKGKKPGDTVHCPNCRKEFLVPIGGLDKLPKNTLIEKLLEVQCTLTTERSNSSAICTFPGHGQKSKTRSLAIWHCVECERLMCSGCRNVHMRVGGTSFHHVLPVEKEISCQEHPNKQLDRFCKTCKTSVCGECCASNHNGHNWSTLVNYVEAQQAELEELRSSKATKATKAGRQPNRQERELPLSPDAIYHDVQRNLILHMAADVSRLKSLVDEEQNMVRILTIVVLFLSAFYSQSKDRMNEERSIWSSEKYNLTLSEEILKRQIQNLTVQLDKERASCLSEKLNYAVMEKKLKRQLHDLFVKQELELLECESSRSKRCFDDTVSTKAVQRGSTMQT